MFIVKYMYDYSYDNIFGKKSIKRVSNMFQFWYRNFRVTFSSVEMLMVCSAHSLCMFRERLGTPGTGEIEYTLKTL